MSHVCGSGPSIGERTRGEFVLLVGASGPMPYEAGISVI